MPVDMDDFNAILASTDVSLPALSPPSGMVERKNGNGGAPAGQNDDSEWQNDPVPAKLDKIRAAFLNAKTPAEVYSQAALLPIGDWLEMVVKLSPKDVKITGGISFRHMLEEFGPIEKDKYRFNAIPVECTEVVD